MSRKTVKGDAEIRASRQTLYLNSAFIDHRCDIKVQEAVHNIMRISIPVARTLSLINLKSGTMVTYRVVFLNVLLLLNSKLEGGHYGHA